MEYSEIDDVLFPLKEAVAESNRIAKEKLMANNGATALILAMNFNQDFADSKFAQDYDIVSPRDGAIANWLAYRSDITGWSTDKEKILNLGDGRVRRTLEFKRRQSEVNKS